MVDGIQPVVPGRMNEVDGLSFIVDPPGLTPPILRPVLDYWEHKRGTRAMPARHDIEPLELKAYLRHLFLIEPLADAEFRYRLIGSEITERYGRNSTGKTVSEAYRDMPDIARWCTRMFQAVVTGKRPVLARGSLHAVRKDFFTFESISLPLSRDGEQVDMIFGAARYTQARPPRPR